jgi:hypothetical protein
MVDHEDQIGFLIVIVILVVLILGIRKYLQFKKNLFKMNLQERHAGKYLTTLKIKKIQIVSI